MPTDHADTYGTVAKNGTATLLDRAVDAVGTVLTQSAIASATYSIYLLDDDDPNARTVVTGHSAASLTVSAILYNTLQTDATWTKDSTGYNFKHTVPIATSNAFAIAGRNYLVEYILIPTSGQKIFIRFRLACI